MGSETRDKACLTYPIVAAMDMQPGCQDDTANKVK